MNIIKDKDGNIIEAKPVTEDTPTMSAHVDENDKDVNELLTPGETKQTEEYDNGIFEDDAADDEKDE